MPDYREMLKGYSDRLKSIPPLLGASVAAYAFRRVANHVHPTNKELAKTPNIQLDEIARPSATFLLYKAMEKAVGWIDTKVISVKNPFAKYLLVSCAPIRHGLFEYPSKFHKHGPKILTLITVGVSEAVEHLFSNVFRSTGQVDPTGLGTVEDILMDSITVLSQSNKRPVNPKFQETLQRLGEAGYVLDYLVHCDHMWGRTANGVGIYASNNKIPIADGKFLDVEELCSMEKKPWYVEVFDHMYGDHASFLHTGSIYEYGLGSDGEIDVVTRNVDPNKHMPPCTFSQVYDSLQNK